MKKSKWKAKPVQNQKSASKRTTLNKLIATAPTLAKKWEIALHGGQPPTPIQRLPSEAFALSTPSAHGPEWQAQAIEQVKEKFVGLLFPALMKDDPTPFEELVEAMAYRRKTEVSIEEFIRRQEQHRRKKPAKKEIGRRFRLALLNLHPDDLLNIQTVKAALEKVEREFSKWHGFDFTLFADDSAIYATMKELNLRLLRPGDAARWTCAGKIVRMLQIQTDGTPKETGMTLKQVEALGSYTCETNFRNGTISQTASLTTV